MSFIDTMDLRRHNADLPSLAQRQLENWIKSYKEINHVIKKITDIALWREFKADIYSQGSDGYEMLQFCASDLGYLNPFIRLQPYISLWSIHCLYISLGEKKVTTLDRSSSNILDSESNTISADKKMEGKTKCWRSEKCLKKQS